MLPDDPIVETTIPTIPEGFEDLVAGIRTDIDMEAENLEGVLGINAFAESFVCEEVVKDLDEIKLEADDLL